MSEKPVIKWKSWDLWWLQLSLPLFSLLGAQSILYRTINKTWHFFFLRCNHPVVRHQAVTSMLYHSTWLYSKRTWQLSAARALLCPCLLCSLPQWLWTGHLSVFFTPAPSVESPYKRQACPGTPHCNGSAYVRTQGFSLTTTFNHFTTVWQIIIIYSKHLDRITGIFILCVCFLL